ncbi:hypothetical protein HMI54_002173 [Coelomomyces lativittatus]|nr:hypothetical protein HMI56_000235 [Coelomomyces lativittatus]KAJ1509715.1 hypothetical protein HMI54_002173 [Coelomomyces lativittatus]
MANGDSGDSVSAMVQAYLWILGVDTALCTLGALMNLMLMAIILWKPRRLQRARNLIFLLNLAFSDFCICLYFLYILFSRMLIQTPFSMKACMVEALFSQVFAVNATMSVMLLAADRYLIVVKKKAIGIVECFVAIFFSFLFSILTGISPLMADSNAFVINSTSNSCELDLSRTNPKLGNVIYIPTLSYLIALILTFFFYFFIILEVRASILRFRNTQSSLVRKSDSIRSQQQQSISRDRSSKDRPSKDIEVASPSRASFKDKILQLPSMNKPRASSVTSSVSSGQAIISTSMEKHRKNFEIQLTRKTFILATTHFILYLPTAVGSLLRIEGVKGADILGSIGSHFILVCLIFDPLWTFLLDPQVKTRKIELLNLFRKRDQFFQ